MSYIDLLNNINSTGFNTIRLVIGFSFAIAIFVLASIKFNFDIFNRKIYRIVYRIVLICCAVIVSMHSIYIYNFNQNNSRECRDKFDALQEYLHDYNSYLCLDNDFDNDTLDFVKSLNDNLVVCNVNKNDNTVEVSFNEIRSLYNFDDIKSINKRYLLDKLNQTVDDERFGIKFKRNKYLIKNVTLGYEDNVLKFNQCREDNVIGFYITDFPRYVYSIHTNILYEIK